MPAHRLLPLVPALLLAATAEAQLGNQLNSFLAPGAGTLVGAEHDGSGNLYLTRIGGTDEVHLVVPSGPAAGTSISSFTGNFGNPLGITTNGLSLYITDTTNDEIRVFDPTGTQNRAFDVSAQSTFPEGVTFNPHNGNLYMVSGTAGGGMSQYDAQGNFMATFPLNGSSIDGCAHDPIFGGFWVTESGTDTVTHYDYAFNAIESFSSPLAAGEGLAIINTSLFLCDPSSGLVSEHDISTATPIAQPSKSAFTANFGLGCGATALDMTASNTPQLGATLNLDVTNIPTGTGLGFLVLGFNGMNPGTDLSGIGATGCAQYLNQVAVLAYAVTGASATTSVMITTNTAFVGFDIIGQAATVSPGANPLGVLTSNGVQMCIGN